MSTDNNIGVTAHSLNSYDKQEVEKVDVTVRRLFEIEEDMERDGLDELLEVTLLSEEHLKNSEDPTLWLTLELLHTDRIERARYGVSRRDLYDFGFNLLAVMATGFRKLKDTTDSPEEKEKFDKLIAGCIALNERASMNDLAFFKDKEKNDAESKRWDEHWAGEITKFQDALNEEWLNISTEPSPFTWNRGDVNAVISRLDGKFTYDDKKDYLADPITPSVPVENRNEHLRQRAYEGYSEWDLKYFRTYLIWLLGQGCIFYASSDAHGFAMSEDNPTFEDYSKFLINFLDGLLRGEANMCNDRTMLFNLRQVDREDYNKSISQLTEIIPGLWD